MSELERKVNIVYTIIGVITFVFVITLLLSSCGSGKMYHIGTGEELSKSRCTGKYIHR